MGRYWSAREKDRIDFPSPARCRSAVVNEDVTSIVLYRASLGTNRGVHIAMPRTDTALTQQAQSKSSVETDFSEPSGRARKIRPAVQGIAAPEIFFSPRENSPVTNGVWGQRTGTAGLSRCFREQPQRRFAYFAAVGKVGCPLGETNLIAQKRCRVFVGRCWQSRVYCNDKTPLNKKLPVLFSSKNTGSFDF